MYEVEDARSGKVASSRPVVRAAVAVAVIVERGAAAKVKEANLEYRAAYQLADLGL